jgi:hypothetical protein
MMMAILAVYHRICVWGVFRIVYFLLNVEGCIEEPFHLVRKEPLTGLQHGRISTPFWRSPMTSYAMLLDPTRRGPGACVSKYEAGSVIHTAQQFATGDRAPCIRYLYLSVMEGEKGWQSFANVF